MRLGGLRKPADRPRLRHQTEKNAQLFTYRARRSDTEANIGRGLQRNTKDKKILKSHFWLQRVGLVILTLAILISAINILTLSSSARIVVLPIDQTSSDQQLMDFQQAANKILSQSVWNRNKLTINTNAIQQSMLNQFTQLSAVSVTVPLIAHRPVIYVQPAKPVIVLVNSTGAYAVSDGGKVLLKAASLAALNLPGLPAVYDQSGLKIVLGQEALSASSISFIDTIEAQLVAQHIAVASFSLPSATNELDAQLTGKPYVAKFNLANSDPRQQAGTFVATMIQLQRQNITPAKYIDVRVDGRAYYQ